MYMLSEVEPKRALEFFEDICAIPHGSGNTKKLSEYCMRFARERGLFAEKDKAGNVFIRKPAAKGYENSAAVILQGHIDMVCEKDSGVDIDFEKDPLKIERQGDFVFAKGTTLGADNGLCSAMILAILDDTQLLAPQIEAVFTVDEEIGMLGATAFDASSLSSKTMINLDSEDEGVFTVSCAGGVGAHCELPIERIVVFEDIYKITLSGLTGGHSGIEIHKGLASASSLMGRVLYGLSKESDFLLCSLKGRTKDNAITPSCEAVVASGDDIIPFINKMNETLKKEYIDTDEKLHLSAEKNANQEISAFSKESTEKAVSLLHLMPQGTIRMSGDIEGLVQTSLNFGILYSTDSSVFAGFSVRSSVSSEKEMLCARLENMMKIFGGKISFSGDYPAWEYKKDSPLRNKMAKIFKEQYSFEPKIEAIHAGLECGIFAGKIPGLDCVSCGPQLYDIHTPKEKFSVSSTQRFWKFLVKLLEDLSSAD